MTPEEREAEAFRILQEGRQPYVASGGAAPQQAAPAGGSPLAGRGPSAPSGASPAGRSEFFADLSPMKNQSPPSRSDSQSWLRYNDLIVETLAFNVDRAEAQGFPVAEAYQLTFEDLSDSYGVNMDEMPRQNMPILMQAIKDFRSVIEGAGK